jgi:tetratricopeptide (TPR) repeat protein
MLLLILQLSAGPQSAVPLYHNLGNHHRKVATSSAQAQAYFDQGLRFMFAFNPEEARRAFQEAIRLDARCAMCYWGVALSYGPNINVFMDSAWVAPAWTAVQRAVALSRGNSLEHAFATVLARRYARAPVANRARLDSAFASGMAQVVKRFPGDLDAATLYAEALLDLRPWNQWTSDGRPQPGTLEIVSTLERVIKANPDHPGACHYYIHAVEASHTPERALSCAERLPALMPGAGHLVHMPAHIYFRVGRYDDAVTANQHAAHTDEAYFGGHQPDGLYPLIYYPHNLHFLMFVELMRGNSAGALAAVERMKASVPADAARGQPWVEYWLPIKSLTLARFGRWKEVLAEPPPPAVYRFATAMWNYALGLAQSATGDVKNAQSSLERVRRTDVGTTGAGGPFGALLLRVAAYELDGTLKARQGRWDDAIAQLRLAVTAEDSLGYIEPPWAYHPVRQTLGAALLSAGRPAEAETVYREDLKRNPRNGWALYGMSRSLKAQGKAVAADSADRAFKLAWAHADVDLDALRF